MTEERTIVEVDIEGKPFIVGDFVAEQPPVKPVDVDASWDGKGSLDDHRQKELAKITQPGFGDAGKVKLDGK